MTAGENDYWFDTPEFAAEPQEPPAPAGGSSNGHGPPADLATAALEYAAAGLHVFPCHSILPTGACSCGQDCKSPGKHPRTRDGLTSASCDPQAVAEWWRRWPDANIAVRTGEVSGIVVLDVDTPKGGAGTLKALEHARGKLPRTAQVLTGSGGQHHYFSYAHGVRNSASRLGSGLDVRGDGGYVIAPPSNHLSGRLYKWMRPLSEELAGPPAWLIELEEQRRNAPAPQIAERIGAGQRNDELASIAGTMRRRGLGELEILAALRETNRARCDPPLADDEVEGIARSVSRYPPAPRPGPEPAPNGSGPAAAADGDDGPVEHTWQPVDLIAAESAPPDPPTIGGDPGLLYPARRHVISGEPESLKSWLLLILSVLEIRAGRCVFYIDLEMGRRDTLARIRDLGLTDEEISTGFVYFEPAEALSGSEITSYVDELLQTRLPSLVVFDAMVGALAIHALDPNSAVDVERFYRTVIDAFRKHGAAVAILDHVVKDKDSRGRWVSGSERKLGATDVHLGLEVISPFSRGSKGAAKILVHKDRPGYLPRPRAGELHLQSDRDTGRIEWEFRAAQPGDSRAEGKKFRPYFLMERVSRHLELKTEPISKAVLQVEVTGKKPAIRAAIAILIEEGYASSETSGQTHLIRSVRPYREADDPELKKQDDGSEYDEDEFERTF